MAAATAAAAQAAPAQAPKDPGIAALISVVCMLFLGAPAAGYFYLGKVKKGIIFLLLSWAVWVAVFTVYMVLTMATLGFGSIFCLPILIVPLAIDLVIVYDVYLEALGKPMFAGISE